MLFSEFQQGTGCKDNAHNHQIYERLELMYMADDAITKEEIYEYGKKLVDNSKSEEELALEAQINSEIASYKEQIKQLKEYLASCKEAVAEAIGAEDKMYYRIYVKRYKQEIADCKSRIRLLKC